MQITPNHMIVIEKARWDTMPILKIEVACLLLALMSAAESSDGIGTEALITDVPWVVSLNNNKISPPESFCTGALISLDWVLTSAHCLLNAEIKWGLEPGNLTIVAGKDDFWKETSETQLRSATSLHVHPQAETQWFNPLARDIGLVEVSFSQLTIVSLGLYVLLRPPTFIYGQKGQTAFHCYVGGPGHAFAQYSVKIDYAFEQTPSVRPVQLEGRPWDDPNSDRKCIISGWGLLRKEYSMRSSKLRMTHVSGNHGSHACPCFRRYFNRRLICVKERGHACFSDYGSSLVCWNRTVGVSSLVDSASRCSVTAWGPKKVPCNSTRAINVFHYVCPYLDWIKQFVPDAPSTPDSCFGANLRAFNSINLIIIQIYLTFTWYLTERLISSQH